MSNELQVKPKDEVHYKVGGQEIKLSPSIVQQFITKGNGQISQAEAINFIQLCRYAELNPFLNEAYLIKFGTQPAQMVTSKEALLKRASRQPDYEGMTSGVVVMAGDDVRQKQGQMLYPGEKLLGGWAEVYRGNFKNPVYVEVSFEEYNTGKSTWAKMPANMINKVAEAAALRRAYPEQLGALYVEEEPTPHDLTKDVTPTDLQGQQLAFEHNVPLTEDAPDIKERIKELRKEVKEAKGFKTLKQVDESVASVQGVDDIEKLNDFTIFTTLKELLVVRDEDDASRDNRAER